MKTRQILIITSLSTLFGIGIIYARDTKKEARHVQNEQELQQRRERSRSVYRGARNPHSEKIPDVAAIAKGDVRIEREVGLPILTPNPAVRFDLQEFLASRACDADSIVVATATSGTSQLTDDQTFLFTNYELRVESVLKDNSAQSVKMGQVITVIRTGGKIQLRGRNVVAEYKAAKLLEVGERYLLFLSFLPERGVYVADNISYQIRNEKIIKLTDQKLADELETGNTATALINRVRDGIAGSCGENPK
ncbi:MAG TPA: hypothetical protein VN956_26045 [Pyrinomonadaceae bacterium]|nr:hypothetical protein [Pyrinomonadaceae bacterium]